MAQTMTASLRGLLPLLALLAFSTVTSAHQLDEYLQATLVAIEPASIRLQINLTPGAAIAAQILPLLDPNHDGAISATEAAAYAALLKRDLSAQLDERRVDWKLIASRFPAPAELLDGWGIIQIEFSLVPGPLAAGAHRLVLRNHHLSGVSAYLINAAKPKFRAVQILAQKRNGTQSEGEIDFTIQPPA